MINSRDLSDLAQGIFELRCTSILLWRSGAKRNEGSYGPGYIRQTTTGELALVMFIATQPPLLETIWDSLASKKSGELFTSEDSYFLEVQDSTGRRWTATRLHPQFSMCPSAEQNHWIAEAKISELHCATAPNRTHHISTLEIWYKCNLSFPFNKAIERTETTGEKTLKKSIAIEAAEFNVLGYTFFVRHESSYLIVLASKESDILDLDIELRINESMEFILGRPLAWTAVRKREAREWSCLVTGAPDIIEAGRMQLPVAFKVPFKAECDAALNLFSLFLQKISSKDDVQIPNLAVAVKCAREGSHGPLDAHALNVAIAIEAVLRTEFSETGKPGATFVADLAKVTKEIETMEISPETKERLRGRISSMAETSAKSRLLTLKAQGLISQRDIKAWENIRHRSAHGNFVSGADQEYINSYWQTMTLFYRLIFAAIGYEGPYRDYGELGWPWRRLED